MLSVCPANCTCAVGHAFNTTIKSKRLPSAEHVPTTSKKDRSAFYRAMKKRRGQPILLLPPWTIPRTPSGCLLGAQRLRIEFGFGRAYQNLLEARDRFGCRKNAIHDSAERCELSRCREPRVTDALPQASGLRLGAHSYVRHNLFADDFQVLRRRRKPG